MAKWKQALQPPAGALPGNLVTRAGVGIIAVLLAGLVLSQSGGDEESEDVSGGEPEVAGEGVVGQLLSRLTQLERQSLFEAGGGDGTPDTDGGTPPPGPPPPPGQSRNGLGPDDGPPRVPTAGEVELRERLRLEALERRARSLRAPSVVQTFRSEHRASDTEAGNADGGPDAGEPRVALRTVAAADGGTASSLPPPPDTAAIANRMQGANAALLAGLAAGGEAAGPAERTVPGVTGPPVGATADPTMVKAAEDPAGWERVYEGSVLSAVLVTQLDGDFAGPVLAQVAVPFYSVDRQRVLVPRGARLLGTAEAVRHQDQSRLAVGFHRLVWPDGRWADLAFHGLNAVGESALADQVDRHYASMFAAAGAVGALAGLTLQGSDPYAGGAAGFRSAAGQGFGQSATQVLGRFLNRLPTVTVRAGHRLRVWVTSDFLVPRPEPHPERMYRK